MPQYFPHDIQVIGSSYHIRRTPGGEQVGGLEVSLTYRESGAGGTKRIAIENTLKDSNEECGDLERWATEATKGIIDYAENNSLNLSRFDIRLGKFFVHDVDSRPFLYYLAAQNALQAALAMWNPPSELEFRGLL